MNNIALLNLNQLVHTEIALVSCHYSYVQKRDFPRKEEPTKLRTTDCCFFFRILCPLDKNQCQAIVG